jgi:hypothetical protein
LGECIEEETRKATVVGKRKKKGSENQGNKKVKPTTSFHVRSLDHSSESLSLNNEPCTHVAFLSFLQHFGAVEHSINLMVAKRDKYMLSTII